MCRPCALRRCIAGRVRPGALAAGAQSLPAGPVSAFDGRWRSAAKSSRRVGEPGRRRVFQLHRLRAQRAADVPAGAVGVLAARQPRGVRRRGPVRRPRTWSGRTRPTSASGRGSTTPSTSRPGRIPPLFGAFGRRGYQGRDNPLIGYPLAYQYLTSLRPDAVPATARSARDARPRAGARASRLARRTQAPACRSSPPSAGTPASRPTGKDARFDVTGASRPARSPIRASATTTAASRFRAASRYRPIGGADPRRVGGARRVPRSRRDAGAVRRRTARTRRPRSAPTPSTRAILARARASSCGAAGTSRSRAGHRRSNARRARRLGRRALPRHAAHRSSRPAPTGWASRASPTVRVCAPTWDAKVTRIEAGAGFYCSATSSPDSPCSTTIATAAASATARSSPASSPTGSDAIATCHALVHRLCRLRGAVRSRRRPRHRAAALANGTIRGRVELRQAPPDLDAARRTSATSRCRARTIRPTAGAASSISRPRRAPRSTQREEPRAKLDQRNEAFVPHVLAIVAGTTVDFPNNDKTYHNVFSLSKTQVVRSRALRRRAVRRPSGSTARGSSASSATSTRT